MSALVAWLTIMVVSVPFVTACLIARENAR